MAWPGEGMAKILRENIIKMCLYPFNLKMFTNPPPLNVFVYLDKNKGTFYNNVFISGFVFDVNFWNWSKGQGTVITSLGEFGVPEANPTPLFHTQFHISSIASQSFKLARRQVFAPAPDTIRIEIDCIN